MATYVLVLHYPKGRTYDLVEEHTVPLVAGQSFERFGRTWKITPAAHGPLSGPQVFDCHPISAPRTLAQQQPARTPWVDECPADLVKALRDYADR